MAFRFFILLPGAGYLATCILPSIQKELEAFREQTEQDTRSAIFNDFIDNHLERQKNSPFPTPPIGRLGIFSLHSNFENQKGIIGHDREISVTRFDNQKGLIALSKEISAARKDTKELLEQLKQDPTLEHHLTELEQQWIDQILQLKQLLLDFLYDLRVIGDWIDTNLLHQLQEAYVPRYIGRGIEGCITFKTWARPPTMSNLFGFAELLLEKLSCPSKSCSVLEISNA
jgi:hypothetical protein